MTYKGAIKQLYEMRDNIWMPEFFKPYFDKIIETMTNDVRENVRGEWINDFCSICGHEAITEWNETGGEILLSNFCPKCGAQMER